MELMILGIASKQEIYKIGTKTYVVTEIGG